MPIMGRGDTVGIKPFSLQCGMTEIDKEPVQLEENVASMECCSR